jgi:hypothetical protein
LTAKVHPFRLKAIVPPTVLPGALVAINVTVESPATSAEEIA